MATTKKARKRYQVETQLSNEPTWHPEGKRTASITTAVVRAYRICRDITECKVRVVDAWQKLSKKRLAARTAEPTRKDGAHL